jgi:hypothetical protein
MSIDHTDNTKQTLTLCLKHSTNHRSYCHKRSVRSTQFSYGNHVTIRLAWHEDLMIQSASYHQQHLARAMMPMCYISLPYCINHRHYTTTPHSTSSASLAQVVPWLLLLQGATHGGFSTHTHPTHSVCYLTQVIMSARINAAALYSHPQPYGWTAKLE